MGKKSDTINYRNLAEHFYYLDTEVYKVSGSNLGKVFPGSKLVSVNQILEDFEKGNTNKLWEEMILVRNMLSIIENDERYSELLKQYEDLKQEMQDFFADEDRMHEQISRDFSDDKFGIMHKAPDNHVVICIAREAGAGGHEIGYRLSERLGIEFYDDSIMDIMMEKMNDNYPGIVGKDRRYLKQSKLIENIARLNDCVIVGRSSGHVLMVQNIPRLSVFIGAPLENRIRRKMQLTNQNRKETVDMIKRTDRERKASYNYYTGKRWGDAAGFDICINSACYGIDGTVDLLESLVCMSVK